MKYQVTLHNSSNIQVSLPRTTKKIVDVDTIRVDVSGGIGNLDDVDSLNRQDNYILIWNESTQKHEYVPAFELLDRADGTDDDAIDYGSY